MLGLGHRRSGDVDGDDVATHGGALAGLVSNWSEAVFSTGWMSPDDWWHPCVETAAEAVLTGGDPCPALARLGGARAQAGVAFPEALDELESLFHTAHGTAPPYDAVRAYVESYGDAAIGSLALDACEDPLTGLATTEYLRTRLGEEYREADRDGAAVSDRAALVVVDTPIQGRGRLIAAVGMIEICDGLRSVFSGGETCASLNPWRCVALVRRRPELARSVVLLQELLDSRAARIGAVRCWIEGLPAHESAAADLVTELADR